MADVTSAARMETEVYTGKIPVFINSNNACKLVQVQQQIYQTNKFYHKSKKV